MLFRSNRESYFRNFYFCSFFLPLCGLSSVISKKLGMPPFKDSYFLVVNGHSWAKFLRPPKILPIVFGELWAGKAKSTKAKNNGKNKYGFLKD